MLSYEINARYYWWPHDGEIFFSWEMVATNLNEKSKVGLSNADVGLNLSTGFLHEKSVTTKIEAYIMLKVWMIMNE